MVLKANFRMGVLFILCSCLLGLIFIPVQAQRCTDAAGGAIDCPSNNPSDDNNDEDTTVSEPTSDDSDGDGLSDSDDACPTEGGPVSNGGCPESTDTTDTTSQDTIEDTTTTEPETPSLNPNRPATDGECQLATATTASVNLRQEPSLDGQILGQLSPSELYNVLGMTIINGDIWYQIAGGWVFSGTVTVDGNCPIPETSISFTPVDTSQPAAGLIPDSECLNLFNSEVFCFDTLVAFAPDGDDTAGLIPETKCTPAPNGNTFCYTILSAAPNDGDTAGLVPNVECQDLQGETICSMGLVAEAPSGDDTAGLIPDIVCTALQEQLICINQWIGVTPDNPDATMTTVQILVDNPHDSQLGEIMRFDLMNDDGAIISYEELRENLRKLNIAYDDDTTSATELLLGTTPERGTIFMVLDLTGGGVSEAGAADVYIKIEGIPGD